MASSVAAIAQDLKLNLSKKELEEIKKLESDLAKASLREISFL
jgi:hypothetical protein